MASRYRMVTCAACSWKGRRSIEKALAKVCPKCGDPVQFCRKKYGRRTREEVAALEAVTFDGRSVTVPRNSDLSVALIEQIATIVAASSEEESSLPIFPVTAAVSLGVSRSTFYKWLKMGERDLQAGKATIFAELVQRCDAAKAVGEIGVLNLAGQLIRDGRPSWPGPFRFLESYSRDDWMRESKLNINSKMTVGPSAPPPPKDWAEFEERREADRQRQIAESAKDADFEDLTGRP